VTGLATLSNGASLTEISTPSSPSAGSLLLYSKTGDKVATLNSAGAEQILGLGLSSATFVTIKNNSGTPNTKADITVAGIATLVNSAGIAQYIAAPNSGAALTCNLGTTGANGIDTGSVNATAPVYFYGIYNLATATWATLASVTGPTAGGPSLPSGYTFSVFLGEMLVDGSSHLRPTYQAGKRVTYTTPPSITPSATVTYSGFFPSTSESALVTGTTSTVSNDTWAIADMSGNTIMSQGALPAGSGENITSTVTVPNTGGTTFSATGTGSSFTAYGWITRANVT
jgi:hypothetical protein